MPIPGLLTSIPPLVAGPTTLQLGAYDFRVMRPDGTLRVLNAAVGIEVQAGVQGLDDPTLDILEHTPPGWDGSLIDSIVAEPRDVFLPLLLKAQDLMSLRSLKQDLTSYLNPRNGPVTLRVALPDATARLIDGYYRPVPGTMDTGTWGVSWQMLGIIIHAAQPFWRSEVDWSVTWAVSSSSASPLPILPLAPGSSNVLGATNPVTIGGDLPTQPVWYITGPLTQVQVTDVGTGASFTFTASVASGDTWVIDTRRGQQGVFDPSGVRQRSTLNAGAQLFPIQPGISQITTAVTGASSPAQVRGTAPVLWLAA